MHPSALTSMVLSHSNELLATANSKGLISFFPTNDLQDSLAPSNNFVSENLYAVAESGVNHLQFGPMDRNVLGAACETCCAIFDVNTGKLRQSFARPSQQMAFSPLNQLLMCSVSHD